MGKNTALNNDGEKKKKKKKKKKMKALTNFRLNKLSPHCILEVSFFYFRYVRLCDSDILREKWLYCLQTVETLIRCHILRCLIWVCIVCQIPPSVCVCVCGVGGGGGGSHG